MIARTNVAAVIRDSAGKILLCKRTLDKKVAPGAWHMPGGKVETGETEEQALRRELREELDLELVTAVDSSVDFTYHVGDETHQTKHFCAVVRGTPVLNYENERFEYVAVEEFEVYFEPHVVDMYRRAALACGA